MKRINRSISRTGEGNKQYNACWQCADDSEIWGNYCFESGEYYLHHSVDGTLASGMWCYGAPWEDAAVWYDEGTYNYNEVRKAILFGILEGY